jgi:uncharacterized tellurite resistance protein B-like protein
MVGSKKKKWTDKHDFTYLFLCIAVIDGELCEAEQALIHKHMGSWFFGFSTQEFAELVRSVGPRLIKRGSGPEFVQQFNKICRNLMKHMRGDQGLMFLMLRHLCEVAVADGKVSKSEFKIVQATIKVFEMESFVVLRVDRKRVDMRVELHGV